MDTSVARTEVWQSDDGRWHAVVYKRLGNSRTFVRAVGVASTPIEAIQTALEEADRLLAERGE